MLTRLLQCRTVIPSLYVVQWQTKLLRKGAWDGIRPIQTPMRHKKLKNSDDWGPYWRLFVYFGAFCIVWFIRGLLYSLIPEKYYTVVTIDTWKMHNWYEIINILRTTILAELFVSTTLTLLPLYFAFFEARWRFLNEHFLTCFFATQNKRSRIFCSAFFSFVQNCRCPQLNPGYCS